MSIIPFQPSLPEELWTAIFATFEETADLCHVSQVSHLFYRLAGDNGLWKPFQLHLVREVSPQRQWIYLGQQNKKESYHQMLLHCPATAEQFYAEINWFFTFLRKGERNSLTCSFSDGVDMQILVQPHTGKAFNRQICNCDCLFPFFALIIEPEDDAPVYDRRSHTANWHKQRIWAIGGEAACEFTFHSKEARKISRNPQGIEICKGLQEGMLAVIAPRINYLKM
jgi:hypothetical protein